MKLKKNEKIEIQNWDFKVYGYDCKSDERLEIESGVFLLYTENLYHTLS
jgi:hypothetical protein